ncbi:MAG: radical SAM protein [Acidobacteriota bacterium]
MMSHRMAEHSILFEGGWHDEERGDSFSFRWMTREARLIVKGLRAPGTAYLRVITDCPFSHKKPVVLEVLANDAATGKRDIHNKWTSFFFPFPKEPEVPFTFRLDRTHMAPGDTRELGIKVRDVAVIDISEMEMYGEGWYPEERMTTALPFRWMAREAVCFLHDDHARSDRYLEIRCGHPFSSARQPALTVAVNGEKVGTRLVGPGEQNYYFPIGSQPCDLRIDLSLDRTFPSSVTQDSRQLGVMVRDIAIHHASEGDFFFAEGWYQQESSDLLSCRWMKKEARLLVPEERRAGNRFLSLWISSEFENLSQRLSVFVNGASIGEIELLHGWNYYSLEMGPADHGQKKHLLSLIHPKVPERPLPHHTCELRLAANKPYPARYHAQDGRELSVRVSEVAFHDNEQVHRNSQSLHKNAILNYREMSNGATRLKSHPLNLGIDLYGVCNIKPHCVYCIWDWGKEMEGPNTHAMVDDATLKGYGPFFQNARSLVNCSIGEPLLHPRLREIVELCEREKKILEISTNGQALNAKTVAVLLGKRVTVYVSLDAARKETYARIRNDRWDEIIPQLRLLGQQRKDHGNLPRIFMVFMPMRVNRGDLEDFFRLSRDINADAVVLRPLCDIGERRVRMERSGYLFDYEREILSSEELAEIFAESGMHAQKYGVPVYNQFHFGGRREQSG